MRYLTRSGLRENEAAHAEELASMLHYVDTQSDNPGSRGYALNPKIGAR